METIKIASGTATFSATEADTTYTLAVGQTITAEDNGIDVFGTAAGRIIKIDGNVIAGHTGMRVGEHDAYAAPIRLTIGEDGRLEGGTYGMVVYGHGNVIRNAGDITGSHMTAVLYGTADFTNTGYVGGGHNGVYLDGGVGLTVVRNAGTISGDYASINGSGASETIINSGTLVGNVLLDSGDDTFIFKNGSVDGEVRGGMGDDTFVVRKAGLTIVEDFDKGVDTVRASIDYQMPWNVEKLYLTGRQNIDGTGGTNGNEMHGNIGRNRLDGAGGMDELDGGRGNDILTGGTSSDHFVFTRGTGRDVVTDFERGLDEIDIDGLKGATDFVDMLENHVTERNGNVVITYGTDVIVLRDMEKADLLGSDFNFL